MSVAVCSSLLRATKARRGVTYSEMELSLACDITTVNGERVVRVDRMVRWEYAGNYNAEYRLVIIIMEFFFLLSYDFLSELTLILKWQSIYTARHFEGSGSPTPW